jgi:hypothetical protein
MEDMLHMVDIGSGAKREMDRKPLTLMCAACGEETVVF